jgi:hypothetical protein
MLAKNELDELIEAQLIRLSCDAQDERVRLGALESLAKLRGSFRRADHSTDAEFGVLQVRGGSTPSISPTLINNVFGGDAMRDLLATFGSLAARSPMSVPPSAADITNCHASSDTTTTLPEDRS